jgi:hypothetical protein
MYIIKMISTEMEERSRETEEFLEMAIKDKDLLIGVTCLSF